MFILNYIIRRNRVIFFNQLIKEFLVPLFCKYISLDEELLVFEYWIVVSILIATNRKIPNIHFTGRANVHENILFTEK